MAFGDVTISGAYAVNDTTGVDGFITSTLGNAAISNANVFTYPAANGMQVYVGVIEGQ